MGQEITEQHFRRRDFEHFHARLIEETDLLHEWLESGRFGHEPAMAGLELEAWLTRPDGTPAPENDAFLAALGRQDVVHELARFNVEINAAPQPVTNDGLARLHAGLDATWATCRATARSLGLELVSIGILPTLRDADLCAANMSDSGRYRALNEQVLRQRQGRPIVLDIAGVERLHSEHRDVMLEAGATSFQGHLQVDPESAARHFNASVIASAATVAIAANSPFLFGRRLWEETRIPLFEQAIAVGGHAIDRDAVPRVGFGTGYANRSLSEPFRENVAAFPVMLPLDLGSEADRLPHLRLHNGTIWRWNRPLVGFGEDGRPHLRIEHRVMAAGPSVADMMANLVFYYGLVAAWAAAPTPELALPFEAARANFYAAARDGLDAEVVTPGGGRADLRAHVLDDLLGHARDGLARLGADGPYAAAALRIVEARVDTGRTGAAWQRARAAQLRGDARRLVREYAQRQDTGQPVHEWDV